MRRPVILLVVLVLIITLLVWAFSLFIQPLLPRSISNAIYIFFLALAGVAGIIAAYLQFVQYRKDTKGPIRLDDAQAKQHRETMFDLVWNTWIEDLLKKSLYIESRIELGLQHQPDAVDHPWDMHLAIEDRQPKAVPEGTPIRDLFDQANGKLLILGEPGTGKTTLLLELAWQTIQRAQADPAFPIPVVFKLSSWTPERSLAEWLVEELRRNYYIPHRVSRAWVEQGQLLLLLDGLDEVKPEFQAQCISAINAYLDEPGTLTAITCRKLEYAALEPHLKLHGALLVELLTPQQVEQYLLESGEGLELVHQLLTSDPELREFANTPLILSILVLTYRNALQEKLKALEAAADYRKQLFDEYISGMFAHRRTQASYTLEDSKKWLSWLAGSMISFGQTTFYLEDINPERLTIPQRKKNRWIVAIYVTLVSGLFLGLISGLILGLIGGMILGLMGALLFGLLYRALSLFRFTRPTERLTFTWSSARRVDAFLLIGGMITGLIFGLSNGHNFGLNYRLIYGLSYMLILGLYTILVIGIFGRIKSNVSGNRIKVGDGIIASCRNMLIVGLITWLIFSLFFGLFFMLDFSRSSEQLDEPATWLIMGLFFGLLAILYYGGAFLIVHFVSKWMLYRSGLIPWKLVKFLDFATDRLFLRRVGGGYIFIHRLLMEHFAEMAEGGKGNPA